MGKKVETISLEDVREQSVDMLFPSSSGPNHKAVYLRYGEKCGGSCRGCKGGCSGGCKGGCHGGCKGQ